MPGMCTTPDELGASPRLPGTVLYWGAYDDAKQCSRASEACGVRLCQPSQCWRESTEQPSLQSSMQIHLGDAAAKYCQALEAVEHLVRGSELDPTIQGYHKWLLAAAAHPEVYLAPDAVPELMAIVALHTAQPHSYSEDCRHLFGKVQVPYRLADSEVYKQAVLVSRVFLRGRGQKHRMATNLNLHEMAYKAS